MSQLPFPVALWKHLKAAIPQTPMVVKDWFIDQAHYASVFVCLRVYVCPSHLHNLHAHEHKEQRCKSGCNVNSLVTLTITICITVRILWCATSQSNTHTHSHTHTHIHAHAHTHICIHSDMHFVRLFVRTTHKESRVTTVCTRLNTLTCKNARAALTRGSFH